MRIAALLMLAAIALAGCQTTPPGKPATKAIQAGPATPAEIAAALGDVPADRGVAALRKKGFKPYSDKGLKGKMAGKTLLIADTYAFHGKDGALRRRDTGAGGATAGGIWTVKNSALCNTVGGGETCTGVFFRGKDMLCWPGIGGKGPETGYLRQCRMFKGDVTNRLPAEGVVSLMAGVPAANGVGAMGQQGFVPLSDKDVWRRIAGNTLEIVGSLGYYAPDRRVEIVNASLGGSLTSTGTWRIRNGTVCNSARSGHEFCTGLYFRGDEVLCWPGIGGYSRDTGYLRACGILNGNRVASTPVPAVLAALDTMSAKDAPAALAKHGFVRLSGNELWRRVAGRTLRIANSLGTYSKDKTITIRDGSLGGELTSSGTWKIKKKNLCHTVRKDQEFCTALYFRGDELLCWPGIGRYARKTGYLRECDVFTGAPPARPRSSAPTKVSPSETTVAAAPMAKLLANFRKLLPGDRGASGKGAQRANRGASAPIGEVMAAMRDVPARDGNQAMARQGFVPLSGQALWRRIAGRTLRIGDSYGYFDNDQTMVVRDMSLGGGIENRGTWSVRQSSLCHSLGPGGGLCSVLYFRGDEILCWPGVGTYARDTGYLRECSLLRGNQAN